MRNQFVELYNTQNGNNWGYFTNIAKKTDTTLSALGSGQYTGVCNSQGTMRVIQLIKQ